MIALEIAGMLSLILTLLIGLILIILGIPGTFLIWAAAFVYGLATKFYDMNAAILLILLGIALLGELIEFVSGLYGARRFGASRLGMIFALLGGMTGGILGTIVCPLAGTIVGVLFGAFAGAFAGERLLRKKLMPSLRAGFGAFIGRMSGTFMKLLLGMVMAAIILTRVFFCSQ